MSQHTFTVGIAHGVDALARCLEVVIGDDTSASVDVDTGIGASFGDDSSASHRHQHCRGADFGVTSFGISVLDVEYASIGIATYCGDACAYDEFNASARQGAA